jgi:hypothetical protein
MQIETFFPTTSLHSSRFNRCVQEGATGPPIDKGAKVGKDMCHEVNS